MSDSISTAAIAKLTSEWFQLQSLQDTLLFLTLIAIKHDEISWGRAYEITRLSKDELIKRLKEIEVRE